MILEVSNKHYCKLDEIVRNFCFEHNWRFSVVFEYYASICIVPVFFSQTKVPFISHTTVVVVIAVVAVKRLVWV